MPFATYIRYRRLSAPHTGKINSLSFSPTASLLASCGHDGLVIIWEVATRKQMRCIDMQRPVVCTKWVPGKLRGLIVGCSMGSCKIFEDALDPGDQGIRVTTGAMGPIFCVDMDQRSRYLALGAGAEVHIAKPLETSYHYSSYSVLPKPLPLHNRKEEEDERVRATAVHLRPRATQIIVSYLNHGIVCWDLKKLAFTWRIEPSAGDHLGHASISQDGRFILAAMLNSTMDLHDTSRPHDRVHSFPYSRPQSRYWHPVKTAFLHNSKAVLCGSEKGDVCIWDRKSGALLQALPHNNEVVLEVCAQQIRDVAYIGTATDFASGKSASIAIWKTELGGGLNSFVIDSIRVNYYLYLQETVENVAYNFQRHLGLVVVSIITVAVAVAAALGLHGPVVLFLHPGCENLACGLRTYVKSALCTLEFVVSFVEAKGKQALRSYLSAILHILDGE